MWNVREKKNLKAINIIIKRTPEEKIQIYKKDIPLIFLGIFHSETSWLLHDLKVLTYSMYGLMLLPNAVVLMVY